MRRIAIAASSHWPLIVRNAIRTCGSGIKAMHGIVHEHGHATGLINTGTYPTPPLGLLSGLQSYCFDFAKPAGLVAKVRAKFTL